MTKPLPPDHPTFGPCITVRRKGIPDFLIYGLLILLLTLMSLPLVIGGIAAVIGAIVTGHSRDIPIALAMLGFGILMLGGLYLAVRTLLRVAEFYHEGAVIRVPPFSKSRREFPYAGCTDLTYALVRQYVNGIYSGTSLALSFKTADGRKMSYSGNHKEKPKGLAIFVLGREFTGEDELDIVREIIATHAAETLAARLASEGTVPWTKAARLSAQGVTPTSGRGKNVLVPFSDITSANMDKGAFALFARDERKAFVVLAVNTQGFFPGFMLFQSLQEPNATPAAAPPPPS